jgi:hypothetical protein
MVEQTLKTLVLVSQVDPQFWWLDDCACHFMWLNFCCCECVRLPMSVVRTRHSPYIHFGWNAKFMNADTPIQNYHCSKEVYCVR